MFPGDEIVYTALPQGIEIALAIGLTGLLATALGVGINLALAFGATLLAQKLLGAPKDADMGDSPTYSFGNIINTTVNGQTIAVVYGQHKVGGQIIQVFTTTDAQGNTILRLLLGLCEGPIQSIAGLTTDQNDLTGSAIPEGIKINGNEARILDSIKVSTRLGDENQTVIPGFRDVVVAMTLNLALEFNPEGILTEQLLANTTYTPTGQPVTPSSINVGINDLSGLFDGGNVTVNGTDAFANIIFETFDFSGSGERFTVQSFATVTSIVAAGFPGISLGVATIHVGTPAVAQQTTDIAVDAFEVVLNFPNGLYKIDASDGDIDHESAFYRVRWREQSEITWRDETTVEVRKRTTSPFDVTYRNDNPFNVFGDEVFVTIEVERLSGNDDDRHKKEFNWKLINQIDITQGINYQHTALLGLEIPAQEQVNGQIPSVTVEIEGKLVWVWDGVDSDPETANFNFVYSSNPAWCAYDLISNRRYGAGDRFDGCAFDLVAFKEWADYCDELIGDTIGGTMKRWELALVLDVAEPFWDQVLRICAAGRATILKDGNIFRPKIQRAASPVQLFTMGNVVRDSLTIQYASNQDRANIIEVQYLDAANDYEQSIAGREDETALESNGDPTRKESIQLYGITKQARAYRAAQFLLNINKRWLKSIEFEAPVDSVASEPGDVFAFCHDLPNWNQLSGRIHTTSATSTQVVIDRDLTITAGQTWKITVRTSGTGVDVLQERVIVNSPGTYVAGTVLTINAPWNALDLPVKADPYGVGNTAIQPHVKLYRMVTSELRPDLTRHISAIEYDPLVYEDDPGIILEDPSDPPITADTIPPNPTGLTLIEGGGPSINASWTNVPWPFAHDNLVYLRNETVGASTFVLVGTTSGSTFNITDGVFLGNFYTVSIVPAAPNGQHGPPELGLLGTILISGNTGFPDPVTNLIVTQQGRNITITWTGIEPTTNNLHHYEIRRGLEWTHGHVIGTTSATVFTTTDWPVGNERFWVRSVTPTGTLDLNPAHFDILLVNPSPEFALINQDEVALGWPGTKTNLTVDGDGSLRISDTFLTGTYESLALDGGTVVSYRAGILIGSRQEDNAFTWDTGSTIWDDATYSWESGTAGSTTWDSASIFWDSIDAKMRDWTGNYYSPQTTQTLEWAFSDDDVTYSAFTSAVPGDYSFRYVKFRITLTRTHITNYQARVSALLTTASHATDAPADATYVVMSLNGTLTDERVLTAGTGISIVDGGAGGNVTINATASALIIQEDDVTVDAAATTIDFTEPLATIVTSSPAGEANVDLSQYILASGARAMAGNLDLGTNLLLNIGAAGTDFTAGGGLTLASTLTLTGFTDGAVLFAGAAAAVSQDAANLFWDRTNQRLAVGDDETTVTITTSAVGSTLTLQTESPSGEIGLLIYRHSQFGSGSPEIAFATSRGTDGAETLMADGFRAGRLAFYGHDGTDYEIAAEIYVEIDGTPGNNDMPGRIVFATTPDGTNATTERMRVAQSGLVTIGTGGTFTLATGTGDLGLVGDLEVDGQTRFDGSIGFQTAPLANTVLNVVTSSATIVNGINVDMVVAPASGIAATALNFVHKDEATDPSALLSVIGIATDVRYNRAVADQPASYAQHAMRVVNYGVQSGATINAGTYTYHGLSINAANAGANVSGGTHTLFDILTDTLPTGFPGGTRHYSIKLNDDAWIVDNAPLHFGTGEDCSIVFDGGSWIFDVPVAITSIIFNESGSDTDFRIESDTKLNMFFLDAGTSRIGLGDTSAPASLLELEEVTTLGGALGDGIAAMIHLDPGYTGAFTVTRHNYIKCENPSVAASAVVTDACVLWFDAAAGTHKAVDAGSTKVSIGVVTQWIKVSINGTIAFIPSYSSKTS